ncbi:NACHT, LRR and PYD domains-containing protein 14-like isoform X2 [Salminus brasiliensis]|uniref:NACHT, LRR and PYD domains-containing protein 14-like isoform X2 n=1 Tax=Salminus brasiliensis TaxID=930266 RepID=UPI003B8353C0
MASGQSDVPKSEDCLVEHTHLLRSLLRDRLKKKYQSLDITDYVPVKLHLSKTKEIQNPVLEGLKVTVKDFLKDENVIEYDDLFKPCPVTNEDVRTVLMKGIPGVGKTTALKRFMLDWAEGRTHQDITFVLPLSLTELSSLRTKKCSFMELLGLIFPELMDTDILKHARVLFVLDDLKSCRVKLNFWHTKSCGDPARRLTLSALLVNLMRGNFFPKAQIWIASSSEGSDFIPSKYVQRVVEIQGLDDVQWEEYVRRAVRDSNVAATAIVHVKSSNNLYFMRSQPGFCQIAATVVEEVITKMSNTELPLTLTEMYTHFLLIQMRRKALNGNAEANHMKTDAEEILKLGKLAWHTLENDYLTVFKEDLRNNDMAPSFAAELSQKWPAFLKEEELTQEKAYHFTHQSTQAYLSALYVAVNYEPSQGNVLHYTLAERAKHLLKSSDAPRDMHKRAVDKALQSKKGTFDSFLIFLLGISAGPSFRDLSCFLSDSFKRGSSETIVPYILKLIKNSSSLNISISLVRCLDELNVSYTVGESKSQTDCQRKVQQDFTPSEWSALAKNLLNSEDQQRMFDLREFRNPEMAFVRLLPAIKNSRVLKLCECTDLCWMLLASALRSPSNSIREIDIEHHFIYKKAIDLLSEGLKSPNCKVEILRELDLSNAHSVPDKAQEDLGKLLVDPGAHLEKLVLRTHGRLEVSFSKILATALHSSTCNLKELDLNHAYSNCDDESAISLLSAGLGDQCCQIRVLRLADCSVRQTGFTALVSAFSSNPSHLKELDLSYSTPGLEAFRQLCSLLEDSHFKLETLILNKLDWWDFRTPMLAVSIADLVSEAYKALASALCSSNLRVLDLSINRLRDCSVELLSVGLGHPACKLEVLRMSQCKITEVGAATLANALCLNPSHLQELDLSYNPVEGTGFDQLNSLVKDPAFKMEKVIVEGFGERRSIEELRLYDCSLTLDQNTASLNVQVSSGDKEAWYCREQKQPLRENSERFKVSQVMCREGLAGRHFCQVEWFGRFATIGMAYSDMSRKGCLSACTPGYNKKSWAISVSTPYPLMQALHDGVKTRIPDRSPWRVGLYLDWSAGILSFYDITQDEAELIHTFYAKFTRPLYLVFHISSGIRLLPPNPGPVCCHDHDPWGMLRGFKECKGCNGSKAG